MKYLIILLLVTSCTNSEVTKCKTYFRTVFSPEVKVKLESELEKIGTSFEKRLDENCKMWVKNGQRF